jgi:hypothetical protein
LVLLSGACSTPTAPENHQLRVSNTGTVAIEGLSILFPSETITVGSVASGATTSYILVSRGVYAYGAFRFMVDGLVVQQPVIDWTGEKPLDGESFTYALERVVSGAGVSTIRISRVDRDK